MYEKYFTKSIYARRFYVIPSNCFSVLSQTRYCFVYLVALAYPRRDELARSQLPRRRHLLHSCIR